MCPFLQAALVGTLLASCRLVSPSGLAQAAAAPLLQVESDCCATNVNAQKRQQHQYSSPQVGMIPTDRTRPFRSPRPVEYLGDNIALKTQGTTAPTRRPVAWLFLRTSIRPTPPTRSATAKRTKPRTSPPVIPRTATPKTATSYVLLIPKTAPTVTSPVNSMPLLKELKLLPTLNQIKLQNLGNGVPPDNEKLIPQLIWKTVRPMTPSRTMISTRPRTTPKPLTAAIVKQPLIPQPVDFSDFDVPDFVKEPCFPCKDCCCCDKLPVPCVNPQQQWPQNGCNCYCSGACQNRPCCCCSSCNNVCHHSGSNVCCCDQQCSPACGRYPNPIVSESYCPRCPDAKPVCFCYPGYEEIHIPPAPPSQATAANLLPAPPAYPPPAQLAYPPLPPVYPLPPAYPPPPPPAYAPPPSPAYPQPPLLAYPPRPPPAYPPPSPAYPQPPLPAYPPPPPPAYPPPPSPAYLLRPSNAIRPTLPPDYVPLPHQAYPPPIPVYPAPAAPSYQLPPAQYYPPQEPQAYSAG